MAYIGVWFICGLLSLTSVSAANLYVRDVEQFEKYTPRLAPGDTLVLQSDDEDSWRDVNLVFEGKGEPGRPIVLTARKPGKTDFTGRSRLRVLGRHLVVDGLVFRGGSLSGGSVISVGSSRGESAQDCRITNTAVIDYNPDDPKVNYKWVSIYGRRNRVDHCYFEGQNHTGQTVVVWLDSEPGDHRIDHNYFAGRPPLGWNGGETVRVGTSSRSMDDSRTIIEGNLFENCDGEAEIISLKSCENVVRRNLFLGSAGAVTLRHGNRNRIEGNWFVGNGKGRTGGVRVIGEGHVIVNNHFEGLRGRGGRSTISVMNGVPDPPLYGYWPVKGALIAHNTMVDCVTMFDIGFGAGSRDRTVAPTGVRIIANLVRPADIDKAIVVQDSTAEITYRSNVWVGDGVPSVGFEARNISFSKDGLISSPSGYGGLEVIGMPDVTEDIDGHGRKIGVAGADVDSSEDAEHRPPTRETVGPNWMR